MRQRMAATLLGWLLCLGMYSQPESSEPPWWSKLVLIWGVLLCIGMILAYLIWTVAVPSPIGDARGNPRATVSGTPAPELQER
jgi:hypothetical protein